MRAYTPVWQQTCTQERSDEFCTSHIKNLLDDGAAEPFLDNSSILGHRKDNRKRQPLFTRDETAQLFAKRRWQHGHCTLNQVDAGGALASITIQWSIGLNKEGNISNVNANVKGSVAIVLDRDCIVEVLGRVRIDGKNSVRTQIAANFELAFGDTGTTVMNNFL